MFWEEKIDRQIGKFNLYERNVYKYFMNYGSHYCTEEKLRKVFAYAYAKTNAILVHRIYLNYVEVPITTCCTLRCKECTNLIQYYERPYSIRYQDIVRDIKRLCEITSGIGVLRLLGGEPLLHKDLDKIIVCLSKEPRIKNIQIVTNGTIVPSDSVLKSMRNNKVSINISDYGNNSYKMLELIKVLKRNRIKYFASKNLKWTCSCDFSYKGRAREELIEVMKQCNLDCINILNGELHLCPRSSHGNDLSIFNARECDYFDIRRGKRKDLRKVLNRKFITACNYCDVFKWQDLPECVPGEQITIKEAMEIFRDRMKKKG